jgi:hypothetical protein
VIAVWLIAILGLAALILLTAARWISAQSWRRTLMAYRLGLPRDIAPDDVAAWLGHVVATTQARRWVMTPPPVGLEVTATQAGIRHVLLVPLSDPKIQW